MLGNLLGNLLIKLDKMFFNIYGKIVEVKYEIKFIVFLVIAIFFLYKVLEGYLKPEKENSSKKILYPIFLCVFVMLSSLSGWKYLHRSDDEKKYEKKLENVVSDNTVMKVEIEDLKRLKKNLELSQANIAKIENVAEIVLLKTNFKQVKVWTGIEKEPKEDDSMFRRFNPLSDNMITKDTYLVVNNYDIPIKLGIDLNNVKVRKTGDKIQVKGITPKVIGFEDWKKTRQIREIRTYECEYAKEKNISNDQTNACTGTGYRDTDKITVHNDEKSRSLARQREDEEESKFKEAMANNNLTELEYINDIVVLKGQAYVQRILSVTPENIEFKEDNSGDDAGFVSLLDFLKNEMTDIDNKINEVKKSPAPVQLESPVSL